MRPRRDPRAKDNRRRVPQALPSRRRRSGRCVAAQAAVSFVNFGLPSIGPDLRDDYGLSLFELGAVLSGRAARLRVRADRRGRRRRPDRRTARELRGRAIAAAGLAAPLLRLEGPLFVGARRLRDRLRGDADRGRRARSSAPTRPRGAAGRSASARRPYRSAGRSPPSLSRALRASGVELDVRRLRGGCGGDAAPCSRGSPRTGRIAGSSRIGGRSAAILRSPGISDAPRRRGSATSSCCRRCSRTSCPRPATRGYSELTASFTYFAVNVTAMVARIAWGKVADRQGGSRRVRTLVEIGVVASVGALVFARRAARRRGRRGPGRRAVRPRRARLERARLRQGRRAGRSGAGGTLGRGRRDRRLRRSPASRRPSSAHSSTTPGGTPSGSRPPCSPGSAPRSRPAAAAGRFRPRLRVLQALLAYCMVGGVARIVEEQAPLVRNASAAAAELIRAAIVDGRLPPGQRLKEEELAPRARHQPDAGARGAARPADGGARRRDAEPRRRRPRHDGDDLEDLYQLRALLEGYAARRAAANISESTVAGSAREL